MLGLGYWLLYAGLAQGGNFALQPWAVFSSSAAPVVQ